MHLSVVSSLDSQCREEASERVAAANPGSVVVHHDLLEGSVVLRRIRLGQSLLERSKTVLEHGCLSCTVRLDVVPTVERLAGLGYGHAVLGLPPGVSVEAALTDIRRALGSAVTIDNAVLAVDPAELEDHIWDKHTLYESGFTSMPEDDRTSGEFLVGELLRVDTVMALPGIGSRLGPILGGGPAEASEAWGHGNALIRQLAPHATVSEADDVFRAGCYNPAEAQARTRRGTVRVPEEAATGPFHTVLHSVPRPLHPGRFTQALPELAAGSHWLRGRLWIASAASKRIAVQGVGPRVWLESTGEWQPQIDDRGTVIAVTGRQDDVDAGEIRSLLDSCQVSAEEMSSGLEILEDPLGLDTSL
jgi:G3E family GTPase